jgi:chromosome partitioning protein
VAADSVLIPMQAEYFALEGISELLDTIERIRGNFNPELGIEGVVLTMFDERTNLAQQVTAELKRYFGDKLCASTIPRNIRLAEAPSHGKAALVYDPRSKGAESYIRLAKEIISHYLPAEQETSLLTDASIENSQQPRALAAPSPAEEPEAQPTAAAAVEIRAQADAPGAEAGGEQPEGQAPELDKTA